MVKIGTGDVIKILEKKQGEELTSPEIAALLKIEGHASSIRRILRSLRKDPTINLKYRTLTYDEKKERFGKVINPTIFVYWLEIDNTH